MGTEGGGAFFGMGADRPGGGGGAFIGIGVGSGGGGSGAAFGRLATLSALVALDGK